MEFTIGLIIQRSGHFWQPIRYAREINPYWIPSPNSMQRICPRKLRFNGSIINNTGTINAANLSNTGTINNNSDTALLRLSGTTDAESLEGIDGSAGFLMSSAVVNNNGGTLNGTSLASQIVVSIGTIEGGTVKNLTSAGAVITGLAVITPELEGVTWLGPLDLADSFVKVQNGLTLTGAAGTGPGMLELGTTISPGTLEFVGDQSFAGATVSGYGTLTADDTLTLGDTFDYDQQFFSFGGLSPSLNFAGAGTILNHGTIIGISARDSGGKYQDSSIAFAGTEFDNFGFIDIRDFSQPGTLSGGAPGIFYYPGTSTGSIASGTFNNEAGGTIAVGQSGGIGLLTIAASSNFTNSGLMLTQDPSSVAGGTLDIAAILGGGGTIDMNGGGLVHLRSASSDTQSIDFVGAGTLMLDNPAFDPAIINGFTSADTIDLGVSASAIDFTSGDLKLQVGGQTVGLDVTGGYSLSQFSVVASAGTTAITVCFATGTRLATTRGLIAVETLRETDEMLPADGGPARPVVWIGHREIDCRRHPEPREVWPVRISAGAFADNVPLRDLYLSPDHAVFVNGVLIPVKYLINRHTIAQHPVPRIEYWHVELPSHGVIAAEGLSVESLLPGSGRAFFGDGDAAIELHPHHTAGSWEMRGCAPLIVAGPKLQAVRDMLASRSVPRQQAA